MSANSYLLMAAGCFLFLILLFVGTRIAANKSGENYVRNNEMREAIYSKHPGDAKIQGIISQPDFYRQLDWNLGRLHKSGAKILLTNSYQ